MKAALLAALAVTGCGDSPPEHGGMVNNHGLDGSVADPIPDGPNAVLSTATLLPFGTVLVNTESAAMPATISTTGGASEISSLAISGTGASAYVIESETCIGSTVDSTSTCLAKVHFAPTAAGLMTATLAITGSANGAVTIALTGSGATAGALAFTPTSGVFGNVTSGAMFDVALQLQDVGTTPTGAITLDISGPDAAVFFVTANNCGGGVAASASCNLTVRFSPATTGARSATLTATDAWGGSMTLSLSGTGT